MNDRSDDLYGEGYTESDTAAKVHCSKTAMHNAIANIKEDDTFHGRNRSGYPLKNTPREARSIRQ